MARIAVDAVLAVADFETKDVNFELIKVATLDIFSLTRRTYLLIFISN